MADKPSVTKASPDPTDALDKREFSVSRKGYDKKEVKSFLAEIEANFRELEKWAELTKARLAIAEKKDSKDEVDAAMMAVFDAKERVLERARLEAEKIEADARDRAAAIESGAKVPADVDEAAAALLDDAERRAAEIVADAERRAAEIVADAERRAAEIVADTDRRAAEMTGVIAVMIEAAQATTTSVGEELIFEAATAEADRLIQDGRGEAATLEQKATKNVEESEVLEAGISANEAEVVWAAASEASKVAEQQHAEAERTRKAADQEAAEVERMTTGQQVGSAKLAQRIVEMEASEQEEAERSRVDEDGAGGRTRYKRESAKLPSMGEDSSKVAGSLKGFGENRRGA